MNKILLPVCYLPPISYFQIINKSNEVVFEQHENFVKQSYRNRCEIYGANGKLKLIVPIQHKGERMPLKDVKISYAENWQKIHWKSLESAYRTSPYFEFYEHCFAPFYFDKRPQYLIDWNLELLDKLIELLSLNIKYTLTTHYEENPDFMDLRVNFGKKNLQPLSNFRKYIQVFENKNGFIPNLSILDLLFNEGPAASTFL